MQNLNLLHALELICCHVGKRLDGDQHINFLDHLHWELESEELTSYFGLSPTNVFPDARIIKLAQAKKQLEQFQCSTDHDEVFVVDAREEYLWWLKQCIDANVDLVTFCY